MTSTAAVPLQVAPEAAPVFLCQPGRSQVPSSLNTTAALVTGYMQISLSVVSLAFGVACLEFGYLQGNIAVPIWGALGFYLVAGILGVVAGHSKGRNACVIIGCLVMSIMAAVTAGVHVIIGSISNVYASDDYYYFGTGHNVVNIICTIIGGIELVVAIISSVYMCSGATCCCGTPTNTQYTSYVVQSGQVGGHGFPMVQYFGQPQFMGQQQVMGQQQIMFQPQQNGQYMGQAQAQLPQQNSQYMGQALAQLPQQNSQYRGKLKLTCHSKTASIWAKLKHNCHSKTVSIWNKLKHNCHSKIASIWGKLKLTCLLIVNIQ